MVNTGFINKIIILKNSFSGILLWVYCKIFLKTKRKAQKNGEPFPFHFVASPFNCYWLR